MRMSCCLIAASILAIAPLTGSAMPLDPADAGAASTFSITHQTQVPGEVLKPGEYSIQIVEHISDRIIVRIDSAEGKQHLLFLGVPNLDAGAGSSTPGLQTWHTGAGSLPTLRGFTFPTGTAVDFVYPKAEAAVLAKANTATIIAIDPESEGRPAKLENLSSDDMREINLWMLTLTSTGPDNKTPALEAKRYQPRTQTGTEVAAHPAQTLPQTNSSQHPAQMAKLDQATPKSSGSKRTSALTELPHTAGFVPVVWSLGLASFLLSGLLFVSRSLISSSSSNS